MDTMAGSTTSAVWAWNEAVPEKVENCVHILVREQAKLRPDALAVDAHDGTWTYRELDDASDVVARYLVQHIDIQAENVIPLCFEKSKWAVVGILGVLKAGAAIVFLDPSHPQSRIEYIISQTAAKVIICSPLQRHLFTASGYPPTLLLSYEDLKQYSRCAVEVIPGNVAQPGNLLYIIFTSGSTGQPKGCEIEHGAFLSGSLRHAELANIHHDTRILQLASFTFDVSMLEILTSLVHGACICIPDMSLMANGPAYLLNECRITWTFMTPSLVKLMTPDMVPLLRTLALGGEPLSRVDVETWADHVQLINGYGPSECSVAATGNTHMTVHTDPSNIGHPVGGVCWIVEADNHDILLPPNEIGELLIEGPILARGYFKDEERTAQAFITRPAWGATDTRGHDRRLYKTGDLAKFLNDGSIQILGRKDTQVKLRGFRIELGEIEHHIAVQPDVYHQVVLLPKTGIFAHHLIAIVSLKGHLIENLDTAGALVYVHDEMHKEPIQRIIQTLREELAAKVPEYMVPEHWIVLENFPLLLSGKLNRSLISKWLSEADQDLYRSVLGLTNEPLHEAPEIDEQLCSVISRVLGLAQSSVVDSSHKSFFSIGGDSITAMQVVAKCRSLGLVLNVKDVLRSKSLIDLSRCIKASALPKYMTEEKVDTPFELSPVQRMYFDLAPEQSQSVEETRFNQSFFLNVRRMVDPTTVHEALERVVARHSMLRVRFGRDMETGQWMQRIPSDSEHSFSFVSHEVDDEEDALPIMAQTQASLSLLDGPVFAAVLFNIKGDDCRLFLVAHHVMVDLVSWRTIIRDLEESIVSGSITAEKPLPFQSWLALQAENAQTIEISKVLPYSIPAADLDYWGMAETPNIMGDTVEASFKLDHAMTKRLLEGKGHSAYRTEPIDILLASLAYSFGQIFRDRQPPAMFREGHGREPWDDSIDVSETVGWFTTMYPLLVDIKDGTRYFGILDVIKRAKDVRHSVPSNGRQYFASRYLNADGVSKFGQHDHVEISFDYLGLYQQMERPDSLLTMVPGYQALHHDIGEQAPRFSLVEVTAEVLQGQMQLLFFYNKNMAKKDLIQSWITRTNSCLVDAIDQLEKQSRELTLSDVPLLQLSYDELEVMVRSTLPRVGIHNLDQVESVYPASAMQNGLLLAQLRPGRAGAYEYNHVLKITPRVPSVTLDIQRLKDAWDRVVQRHTSLRTVFIQTSGISGLYDQIVMSSIKSQVETRECTEEGAVRVFESQDPVQFREGEVLHRLTICKVSPSLALCRLEINHAIIDGSSIANLLSDFVLAHDGLISERPGFMFEDYIKYTLELPEDTAREFWMGYLTDVKPTIFPAMAFWEDAVDTDRKLGAVRIDIGVHPSELSRFCDDKLVTWVNVFQLAWGLILKQYVGTEDVCFGLLSSGRDAPLDGIQEGVGAFLTMLVSRMALDQGTTLSMALQDVARDSVDSLPHQYFGLANIQHGLSLGNQPLFNTIISFHRDTDQEMHPGSGICIEAMEGHDPTEYVLSLDVGVSETKINVSLQFWTDETTRSQAESIGATFAEAVKAIITRPETDVGRVDLVGDHHIQQLRSITAVNPEYVSECVHHAIERQALATPDHEAICSYEGSWSYAEVDRLSSQLAHHLVSYNIGPEVIVPYCFSKSAYAIISMLAILKAGGAAVALDPGHPVGRLRGLIQQCGSTVVLADPRTTHLFSDTPEIENVLVVNEAFFQSFIQPAGTLYSAVEPHNACFVVFTSGTTGQPKGIVLEHRNLRTCAAAMGPVLGFGPETRALQFAAYIFDVSLQDILTTLMFGGTVCVISDEQRMNDLSGGINLTRANWADLTATVSGMLYPADVPTLKRLNNGGEALNRDVVERWADHVELYNLYGPAETTVNHTASARLSTSSPASNVGPAYGTHVWIVDAQDHNCLVPPGCAGEILIEGPLVARGYLNDPEKTAAAFIEDPLWASQFPKGATSLSRRLYKTGDLGIMNTDGSITILGRRDAQVKINGQRVELDEVMYQAQRLLPQGYQVAVVATSIKDATHKTVIVAFISIPNPSPSRQKGAILSLEMSVEFKHIFTEMKHSLAKVLPSYMMPSIWIPTTEIPYTTSGKLDRKKLQGLVATIASSQQTVSQYSLRSSESFEPPTNRNEEILQELFGLSLGINRSQIGRGDDFFALGGDSVDAMKLVTTARKQFGLILYVTDIFKHPTLSHLAAFIDDRNKAEDTQLGLESAASFDLVDVSSALPEAAAQCKVSSADIEDIYPTSALQEGMMALGLRSPGAYITQAVFALPSTLDIPRMQAAWDTVAQIHAILRTRIISLDSIEHMQVVTRLPPSWTVIDVEDLEVYLARDKATAFGYGESLLRLAVVRQTSNPTAYFVWTAHHAIYDGWSMTTVFNQVADAFWGKPIMSSTPFKHFIGHIASIDESAASDFWKETLDGRRSCPVSFPPKSQDYASSFSGKLATKMTIHAQAPDAIASGILDSTIKRAAWALTLASFSDSPDVVFAQTLSGRNVSMPGIEEIMGPTIATVPVRVRFPPKHSGVTVRSFLEKLQAHALESMQFEQVGLQRIRELSIDARNAVDNISNLFVIQPKQQDGDVTFLEMEPLPRHEEAFLEYYPLTVLCNLADAGEYTVEVLFDENVIPSDQMTRILHQFQHMVQQLSLISSMDTPLDAINMLNPYDLHDIRRWNADLPMGVDACIPDLISENVALRPDSEAVCAWDGQLSYQEFELVTLKLSSHLASLGVGREVRVGLCFDKSIWNLVSMYAVMRTGGVCVPLLPTYPRGRITDILEDIEASLVLVSPQHSSVFEETVPNVLSVDQYLLDSLPSHVNGQSTALHHIQPRDAAFIVFTSGSTGRPKGVVIEHSGFCTMAHYQLGELMLGPESRVLQFATHTFDICLFESFAPLVRGGCVCIPSEHQRMNNLVKAIDDFRVDWIIMVSTIAQTFYPEDVPSLKTLVLGGEPLRADIHARWASRVNLFNDYGPAECSILAVMTPSTSETPPSMIGKGHGGRTWVVDKDDHDRLLPVGCVGELLIEGPILARGYLNDPQKTADAYINDPLWASSLDALNLSSRFYKTGDLVRYAEDGNLICLGRKDTQIKIRGLRVELGEIEHHVKISSLKTYKQAVEKVLLGDDVDKAALAAFVVPSTVEGSNAHDDADRSEKFLPWSSDLECQLLELRQYLTKSLPAYMVPTLYVPLHDMPETQTNKMDRNALKRIGAALDLDQIALYSLSSVDQPAASGVRRAPSTKTEILLQGLWARLMNIEPEQIDAHDNFFAKGGDSIKAMRLTSLARSHGVSLIVADIFKNPELSQMALAATWLDDREDSQMNDNIEPFDLLSESHGNREMAIKDAATQCSVSADAIRDMYPCTPLQEGLMELATRRQGAYTAQRVFRFHDDIDIGRFQAAWSQLVALHPILRTRIVLSSTSGEAIQVVIDEDVTWQQELTLPDYLVADSSMPIHYGSPLARYALDAEHRHFIWTVHHALYDGYSSNMLMEQLDMLYRGSHIHPLVTHYNAFVRAVTSGVSADELQAFWTKQLAHGAPESFPHLPSATHQSCPDSEITTTINVEGHRRAGKPFMLSTLLRSAWAIVTARYMGSQHIAFAATNSGRNADVHGIDTIIGPTITTVPLHIAVAPDTKIDDFLDGVQQLGIDMVPFEQAGVQRAFATAERKQNLRNLFVIQQSLVEDSQESSLVMDEVVDKALLRGFHVYPVVVECNIINDEKVHVELQFDKSVLAEPTARFVLEQFEHVIDQLLTLKPLTSGALLADIGLVPSAHVEKMVSWNDAVDTQDVEECVHDIFRRQANVRPEAEAVVSTWEGSLTYGQLDEMSDRLAAHLVEKGVGPEHLVPMCLDKSIYTVVAMMATLKAGGACVHLGIKSPSSRMVDIIRQADANVILTDASNSHKFVGQLTDVEVVTIDASMFEKLSARGATSVLPRVSPTNPAFVLFTSGSTGKPKGVVVEHGSLCTSSRAHGTNRKVGPDTRLFQFAAYTFDVSVADIFTTLQRGGCICVPSEDERINDLSGTIDRLSCNYAFLTPTVAGMVEPSSVPDLRTLILGGELLTSDNIHRWAPRVDLIISYGMTECSIHCVDAVPLTTESDPANLGRPSGCQMWIVDENDHNKLAPLGAIGELVIEGRMVSRGYLNDKIKTDAAFITNPAWASGKTGSTVPRRMYKTGDLCRYSPAGEICYVSRKDFQVKHHGQRIELGDIEHHTTADERVHQAVVLLPKGGPLQKKLVAVLSLESSFEPLSPTNQLALVSSGLDRGIADLQVSAIRSYLATKVPDYMVPAVWIAVQALPLTPNNKLDRVTVSQWLEKMDEAGYQAIVGQGEDAENDSAGSPATSQQKVLHDVLTQVLGLPSIHMGRSFLDLGGDSITAMQLRAKCRAVGLSLTVPDILTSRSMFDLASAAQLLHTGPTESREIIGVPFPVTAWQQASLQSARLSQMVNAAKVTPPGLITVPNLLRAVEALVQQYSSLRTRFSRNDQGQWDQTVTKGPSSTYYTFRAHSLSSLGELDPCLSNLNETKFDVETEALFAVHLFQHEDGEGHDHTQVIVLRMHALIADAKSMSVLVEDLLSLLGGHTIPGTEDFSLASLLAPTREKTVHEFTGGSEFALDSCSTAAANHVSGGVIERTITMDKASTSLLMGDSNRALSTVPQDTVVAAITLAWREVFGRHPSSVAVRDDSRPTRAVGQFSRLRQNPKIDYTDWIQVLARVKDSRVGERIDKSLMRRTSSPVEVLIDTVCRGHAVAFGEDYAHDLICDAMSWAPHSKLQVTPTLSKNQMMLKLTYNDDTRDQDAFDHLTKTLEQRVLQLVAMLNSANTTPTLSDFPSLKLGYAQLEKLQTVLDAAGVSFSDVEAIVPCTPLQQRMLESQKRIPGSYQSDTAHRITSGGTNSIDVARLQRAFVLVTARHEALRTIFLPSVTRPGEHYQLVLNHYEPSVQVIHCEEAGINSGSTIQEHHTVHHASMKPHVGLTLFQTESSLCTKLEISHALQDGASMRIIYQDLVCAYQDPESFAAPSTSPSPGFREYAAWFEAQHQNTLTESTHFWTQYLEAFMGTPCHVPRSKTDPAAVRGENVLLPISIDTDPNVISQVCRLYKVTPSTFFLSAWATCLQAVTGLDDVLFAQVVADRDIADFEEVVGPLINMVGCRVRATGSDIGANVLRRVHESFLETLPFQQGFVPAAAAMERESLASQLPWNSALSVEYVSDASGDGYYPTSAPGASSGLDDVLGFETLWGSRAPEFDVVLGVLVGQRSVEVQLGYWNGVMDSSAMKDLANMYQRVVSRWIQENGEGLMREIRTVV